MIDTINNNKITIKQSENNIITISQCIKDLHFYITNEKNITKEITSITDTINKYKSIIQHYKEELKFIISVGLSFYTKLFKALATPIVFSIL